MEPASTRPRATAVAAAVLVLAAYILTACGTPTGTRATFNTPPAVSATASINDTTIPVATTPATTGTSQTAPTSTSTAAQPTLPTLPDLPAPIDVPSIDEPPTVTIEPSPGGALPVITTPVTQNVPTTPGAALIALSGLAVTNEQRAGYARELFEHWIDADGDGCDTRAEVLAAESLDPAQIDPYGCRVVAGRWYSSYDGVETDNPANIDIDMSA